MTDAPLPSVDSVLVVGPGGSRYLPLSTFQRTPITDPPVSSVGIPAGAKVAEAEGTSWALAGKWAQGTDGEVYTSEPASTATLRFRGTYVGLVGVLDVHHGLAQVIIDGKVLEQVSLAGPTRAVAQLVWQKTDLPEGEHVLEVKPVTGKGPIALDAARVAEVLAPATPPSTGTPSTPDPKTPSTPTTPPAAGGRFTVKGSDVLLDGKKWYFTGFNSFTATGNCGSAQELAAFGPDAVDAFINSMRDDGHGLLRIFFYPGWNHDRMKRILDVAAKRNVFVLICLGDGNGGCGARKMGEAAWFANTSNREQYRSWMVECLRRYKDHPALFAFEWANEAGGGGTAAALRKFIDEMGALAAKEAPKVLWSSGTVASYWLGGDANFKLVNESPYVHIVSTHEYDEGMDYSHWVKSSVTLVPSKPHLVGEYGMLAAQAQFLARAARYRTKNAAYLADARIVGALAWAVQPGNGGSAKEYGNVEADQLSLASINGAKR